MPAGPVSIFSSKEQLEEYCLGVAARLRERREQRRTLCRSALQRLQPYEKLALAARDSALAAELAARLERLEAEERRLAGIRLPEAPPRTGDAPSLSSEGRADPDGGSAPAEPAPVPTAGAPAEAPPQGASGDSHAEATRSAIPNPHYEGGWDLSFLEAGRVPPAPAAPEPEAPPLFVHAVVGDRSYTLAVEGRAEIGRRDYRERHSPEIDFWPDDSVSRHHATILNRGGSYFYTDLGSTNGTKLNGKRVAPRVEVELHVGDEIEVGDHSRLTVVPPGRR